MYDVVLNKGNRSVRCEASEKRDGGREGGRGLRDGDAARLRRSREPTSAADRRAAFCAAVDRRRNADQRSSINNTNNDMANSRDEKADLARDSCCSRRSSEPCAQYSVSTTTIPSALSAKLVDETTRLSVAYCETERGLLCTRRANESHFCERRESNTQPRKPNEQKHDSNLCGGIDRITFA